MWEGRVAHDTGLSRASTFGQWSIIESEAVRRQFWGALCSPQLETTDLPTGNESILMMKNSAGNAVRNF
jgi:hypothetical protein